MFIMNKKNYQKPAVTKIKFQVKNAVLSTCRISPDPNSNSDNNSCTATELGVRCLS